MVIRHTLRLFWTYPCCDVASLGYYSTSMARLPPSARRHVTLVEHTLVRKKDVYNACDKAIAAGNEGLMVRFADMGYRHGIRASTLLKVKRMFDDEFRIIDVIEGTGRLKGMTGAVLCETNDPSRTKFKAMFGVDDSERLAWWENRQNLIGRYATVRYQELSAKGIPRFPQFKCVRGSNRTDFV